METRWLHPGAGWSKLIQEGPFRATITCPPPPWSGREIEKFARGRRHAALGLRGTESPPCLACPKGLVNWGLARLPR